MVSLNAFHRFVGIDAELGHICRIFFKDAHHFLTQKGQGFSNVSRFVRLFFHMSAKAYHAKAHVPPFILQNCF